MADQAAHAGLLGAIRRDLSPYGYCPADPRYEQLMQNVMAIFDPQASRCVPLPTRVAAAEALGRAGDLRPGVGLTNDRRALPEILRVDVLGAGRILRGGAYYSESKSVRPLRSPRALPAAGHLPERGFSLRPVTLLSSCTGS